MCVFCLVERFNYRPSIKVDGDLTIMGDVTFGANLEVTGKITALPKPII